MPERIRRIKFTGTIETNRRTIEGDFANVTEFLNWVDARAEEFPEEPNLVDSEIEEEIT